MTKACPLLLFVFVDALKKSVFVLERIKGPSKMKLNTIHQMLDVVHLNANETHIEKFKIT